MLRQHFYEAIALPRIARTLGYVAPLISRQLRVWDSASRVIRGVRGMLGSSVRRLSIRAAERTVVWALWDPRAAANYVLEIFLGGQVVRLRHGSLLLEVWEDQRADMVRIVPFGVFLL